MTQLLERKAIVLDRIAAIAHHLIDNKPLLQERLDREEFVPFLVNFFGELSVEELEAISEPDLRDRIEGISVTHAVAGLLNDLTPEQMKAFDEAVEGKYEPAIASR